MHPGFTHPASRVTSFGKHSRSRQLGAGPSAGQNEPMRWLTRVPCLLADLVLPGGCCACGAWLTTAEGPWCTECALAMGRASQQFYCPRCGLTTDEPAGAADGCPRCVEHRIAFDGFCRVGEYDGLLRQLICKFKFGRCQQLDRPLGRFLAVAVGTRSWACEVEAIVPVPLSWRSRLAYRFSPPRALAQELGRELKLPVLPLLYEKGKRRRQVGLTADERRQNVHGVFRLARGARPAGGIFCMVHDVSTTGATLQEVARVLKQAGATRVYAAVLAKTNPERAHALQA